MENQKMSSWMAEFIDNITKVCEYIEANSIAVNKSGDTQHEKLPDTKVSPAMLNMIKQRSHEAGVSENEQTAATALVGVSEGMKKFISHRKNQQNGNF